MVQRLYGWLMSQTQKKHASLALGLVSFLESSVSPFPPDPLMIPMILQTPSKAWRLAFLTTATSVLGGMLGYAIGFYLFETVGEWIISTYHLQDAFTHLSDLFNRWGFWIILLKGLTPIPFKIVTITSGVTGLNFFIFILGSILSRGLRFYLEAWLLKKYGPQIKSSLEKNLMLYGLLGLGALIIGFFLIKWVF